MKYPIAFLTLFLLSILALDVRVHAQAADASMFVSVITKDGGWLTGLTASSFELSDEKEIFQIQSVFPYQEPTSVCFLIGDDGSFNKQLSKPIRDAIEVFMKKANSGNEYRLIFLNAKENQTLVEFTNDKDLVLSKVGEIASLKRRGRPTLFDPLKLALQFSQAKYKRKVVIAIDDGKSESTSQEVAKLSELANKGDVTIYVINIPRPQQFGLPPNATGGRVFHVNEFRELNRALYSVAEELGNSYQISFRPSSTKSKEGLRNISLKLNAPKGFESARALYRPTYLLPSVAEQK